MMDKILMITPYTPDNQGVGVSYTSQLIKYLSNDYLIDLVYFRYDDDQSFIPYSDNIKVINETVINTFDKIKFLCQNPLIFPLFSVRFDRKVKKLLKRIATVENYQFVYLDFSQTFIYAKYIDHPNVILMSHDVIAQKYSRMQKYLRPWAVITERSLLKKGRITFTFSKKDSDMLTSLYGVKSLYTTFFLNKNVVEAIPRKESNYFVFFGSWGRPENSEGLEWFIDNVYHLLPRKLSFKIIGDGLPKNIQTKIDSKRNIEYLGFVENPYPIIADAKAEIAPLFKGAGVKVKCVESLASGTPVIGTDIAMEGIEEFKQYFILASTPRDYVKAICECSYPLLYKREIKEKFINSYNNKRIIQYLESNS